MQAALPFNKMKKNSTAAFTNLATELFSKQELLPSMATGIT